MTSFIGIYKLYLLLYMLADLITKVSFLLKSTLTFLLQGLEVAIATNLNPGNWVESMQMAIALACRNHNMTLNQAIKASTLGGAKALRISDEYGSIEVGKYADIQILNTETYKKQANLSG